MYFITLLSLLHLSLAPFASTAPPAAYRPNTALVTHYSLRVDPVKSGLDARYVGRMNTVSLANGTLWIGGVYTQLYSEKLLLNVTSLPPTSLYFTSYHSATRGQYIMIAPTYTAPFYTISPDDNIGFISRLAMTGFDFDGDGRLRFQGAYDFIGCRETQDQRYLNTYQLWSKGIDTAPEKYNCTGLLYLYRDTTC